VWVVGAEVQRVAYKGGPLGINGGGCGQAGNKRRTRSLGYDFSTASPFAGELTAHRNSDKAYQIHHNQHQLRFSVSAGFLSDFWEKTLECCV